MHKLAKAREIEKIRRHKKTKTTDQQWNEGNFVLESRKPCFVCRCWMEIGTETYRTGHPIYVYRHKTCARSKKA